LTHNADTSTLFILLTDHLAGATRLAVRTNGTLSYLLTDHLGSTSLTTDSAGSVVSELRYTAWGEVRYQSGTTPTNYTYTGQYSNVPDFGLMFYNARWYDPAIGRFAQADTDVPASQGVQAYDRYAYTNNNPLRYTDPDGHFVIPAAIIVAGIFILKAIDYGWTGYDIYQAGKDYLSVDATPAQKQVAAEAIGMAISMELLEPDDLSPVALPLDDIVRHGDDIADIGKKAPVVIGETMKRVRDAADEVGGKWYQAWKIDPWDFDLAMKRNERWIHDIIKEGREIIDIGLDPTRITRSPFYEMEKRIIDELKYRITKYVPK